MTIYIPKLHDLPKAELSQLGEGARFSTIEANGSVSAYVYEWPDLKVIVNVMPKSGLARHLDGFVGWARSVATGQGRALDKGLVRRIQSTTMVLGFVVEKTTDREVWHERVQDMI